MSEIMKMLQERHKELKAQKIQIEAELREVSAAIMGIQSLGHNDYAKVGIADKPKLRVVDGIIKALENDRGTPVSIEKFITEQLGLSTTRNTIHTTLSRLKADGRVDHDGEKWLLPQKNSAPGEPTPGADKTGEVTASPYESKEGAAIMRELLR